MAAITDSLRVRPEGQKVWLMVRTRLHRAHPDFTPSSASAQLAENPYISPEELTQYMVDEDDELSLFAVCPINSSAAQLGFSS